MNKFQNDFTELLGLSYPLVVAPMGGGPSSVSFVAAASEKGALGSIGAAYSSSQAIDDFVKDVRSKTSKPFCINLFIPAKLPRVDSEKIQVAIKETEIFRKELCLPAPNLQPPYEEDFDKQFESVLRAKPKVFSFIFGLLASEYIKALRAEDILVAGTATSVAEAMQLVESGVDAIICQGIEAGGHRGIFDSRAVDPKIKTLDLIKAVKAKTNVSLIAAGGIMASDDIKQILSAGAQAVQMGTAFLCTQEAGTSAAYRQALLQSERHTKTTRAFSGRLARGIENRFMNYMDARSESILPFPAQNKFTRDLRNASTSKGLADFLSLWAGTGDGDLWTGSTADLIENLFS